MSSDTTLPVADPPAVHAYARTLLRRNPRAVTITLALHAAAATAGLAGPWLLGDLVDAVKGGAAIHTVDRLALILAGFLLAQGVLTRAARYSSHVLGERALAELREEFVERVLALPLGTVERAGTGDLLTRTTRDIDALARSVRWAAPEIGIAALTTALTVGAAFLAGPLVALPCLLVVPLITISTRWYLRRAPAAYLREHAAYSTMNASLAETVDGARTVEALGLQRVRVRRIDDTIGEAFRRERHTLFLRSVWFPALDFTYILPVASCLFIGGLLYANGLATLGQVTTVALYVQQLIDPVDRLISWLDELQVGSTSLARLLGVAQVPDDRDPTDRRPQHERIMVDDVRFAYVPGRDVLHGVDLSVERGERLAMVGPSGAGKSTLGRLLAGIHPPRAGSVTVGDARLTELPLDELRRTVVLLTQEHHVFVGTLRDNVALARPSATDDEIRSALAAVDALPWVLALPGGVDTRVGSGERQLTPAQAQQVALARVVLADPHTLVLDEATSLLDPRAARHLERSLAAVLSGRTVIAIAHRLHTAHDADRVAVVEDGRITELGSHDDLLEAGNSYAELWASWRDEPVSTER